MRFAHGNPAKRARVDNHCPGSDWRYSSVLRSPQSRQSLVQSTTRSVSYLKLIRLWLVTKVQIDRVVLAASGGLGAHASPRFLADSALSARRAATVAQLDAWAPAGPLPPSGVLHSTAAECARFMYGSEQVR